MISCQIKEIYSKIGILLNIRSKMQPKLQYNKVKTLWEGHKIWKKSPTCFDKTAVFKVHNYILRRPQNFAKSSPYFWLVLHLTKVRWRFCKILWPSQNIWTLLSSVKTSGRVFKNFVAFSENLNFKVCDGDPDVGG